MGFYDWVLALHVLSTFAIAAALVLFSVLVVARRRIESLSDARLIFRVGSLGGVLVGAGAGIALVLGIVLAIDSDAYELWNGWIIAAIVLWALMGFTGRQTGEHYNAIQKLAESDDASEAEVIARLRAPKGPRLHFATEAIFVLLLLDMMFKPGA